METGYQIDDRIQSKGGKVNSELFRGIDNIYQMPFRTGEIWELIDDISNICENISIKKQKDKKSKPIICTNHKIGPEMKQLTDDMTITPWRTLQVVKDEKLVKSTLCHVTSGEFPLEEMCSKFQK